MKMCTRCHVINEDAAEKCKSCGGSSFTSARAVADAGTDGPRAWSPALASAGTFLAAFALCCPPAVAAQLCGFGGALAVAGAVRSRAEGKWWVDFVAAPALLVCGFVLYSAFLKR